MPDLDDEKNGDVTRPPVLSDHDKVGRKLVPPLLSLIGREVSYVNDLVPDLLWLDLLNTKYGYRRGFELAKLVATLAREVSGESGETCNFALASGYDALTEHHKAQIRERLEAIKEIEPIVEGLRPLLAHFEDFPMSFLGLSSEKVNTDDLLIDLRHSVERIISRYAQPALIALAINAALLAMAGKLHLSTTVRVPNFNSLLDDPDSEDAKHASAFVRSFAMVMMGQRKVESTDGRHWPEIFWNRAFHIAPCETGGLDDATK